MTIRFVRLLFVLSVAFLTAGCENPSAGSSQAGGVTPPPASGLVQPANQSDYTSTTLPTLTLKFVRAGVFQRNATATDLAQVSAFRMATTEVTRDQWTTVMGTGNDPTNTSFASTANPPGAGFGPVLRVGWFHAVVFCNKLSLADGLTPVYSIPGIDFATVAYASIPIDTSSPAAPWPQVTADWTADGYRLPTEMEWLWAAMGADKAAPGAVNTTGYAKPFAGSNGTNAIGDYAWYQGNRPGSYGGPTYRTMPVAQRLPNELGLYDLTGNAAEWEWDFYGGYPKGTIVDYRGSSDGASFGYERLYHGGSFSGSALICQLAYKQELQQGLRMNDIGLRVVRN